MCVPLVGNEEERLGVECAHVERFVRHLSLAQGVGDRGVAAVKPVESLVDETKVVRVDVAVVVTGTR